MREGSHPITRSRFLRYTAIVLFAATATFAAGCTGSLLPSAASSNQSASPTAPEGAVPRLRPQLVATNRSFLDTSAGRDAQKKMDMGSMGRVPSMKAMKGMDAPKMPGMGGSPPPLKTPGDMGGMPGMQGAGGSEPKPADAAIPAMNGALPTGSTKQPTAEPTPAPLKP